MRLDAYLAENNVYASRTRAARAIESGCVKVNGTIAVKASLDVSEHDNIEALPDPLAYVSRGALKLEFALSHYNISVKNLTCVDVGASTGGFTEVLLNNGADFVYAVDVGTGQLAPSIASNERVRDLSQTDIRGLDASFFERKIDFLSCDCSFISLKKIFPACYDILSAGAFAIFLVKPQFEVGRKGLNKKGVVKDDSLRISALRDVILSAESAGFSLCGDYVRSPIEGGDGNVEFIICVQKTLA